MGAPSNQMTSGNTTVWSYGSGGGSTATGVANANGSHAFALGIARQRYCTVNVVFSNGTVQQVNYSGNTGGLMTRGEECAYAVRNCVHP